MAETVRFAGTEFNVQESNTKVRLKKDGLLVYSFRRTDNGCILRWENMSISRAMFLWLDSHYGVVSREISVKGHKITCPCDSPELQKGRDWSDGMTQHYHYTCRNCGRAGAVYTNYKDQLTSAGPFMEAEE